MDVIYFSTDELKKANLSSGFRNEEYISRNLLKDMGKMIPRKGRLVPADPDLFETLFVCNVC